MSEKTILSEPLNINRITVCENEISKSECINYFNNEAPIKKKLVQLIEDVNDDVYKFNINIIRGLKVYELNQQTNFNWTIDLGYDEISTSKKLTAMLFLSARNKYNGGKIVFEPEPPHYNFSQKQGSVLIFPSYFLYKFNQINKGNCNILVCWACGPAFR